MMIAVKHASMRPACSIRQGDPDAAPLCRIRQDVHALRLLPFSELPRLSPGRRTAPDDEPEEHRTQLP